MADFKKQGGTLSGREERYDGFEGEPRSVGGALGGTSTGTHHGSTNTGPHNSSLENKIDPRVDSDLDGSRNMGATGAGTQGGYGSGPAGSGYDTTTHKKPGLMDKLNPKTGEFLHKSGITFVHPLTFIPDSDGDGRAGIGK